MKINIHSFIIEHYIIPEFEDQFQKIEKFLNTDDYVSIDELNQFTAFLEETIDCLKDLLDSLNCVNELVEQVVSQYGYNEVKR